MSRASKNHVSQLRDMIEYKSRADALGHERAEVTSSCLGHDRTEFTKTRSGTCHERLKITCGSALGHERVEVMYNSSEHDRVKP